MAEPTKAELLKKVVEEKRRELKSEARSSVIEKYGGEEYLEAPPAELLLGQTEQYLEYSRTGNVSFQLNF